MKRHSIILLLLILVSPFVFAQTEKVPAFPGAEGFGRYATGGRGGAVYHVTTLEDGDQKGTFRWACKQKDARTIVFDVAGTIQLKSQLKIGNDNLTIAGQTAPGEGICIAGYPCMISANNVICRFIRVRLGNEHVAEHEGDGFGLMEKDNVIIDHCSVSWSVDECLSVYGGYNTTVQWCLVAQSMRDAGHSKGTHGYGGIWGGSGASFLYNLMCHHDSRTPRLGTRPRTETHEYVDMRNNVIYNWAGNGCYGCEGMNFNIVNNYYKAGPATQKRNSTIQQRIAKVDARHSTSKRPSDTDPLWLKYGDVFVSGNYFPAQSETSGVNVDNWTYGVYNQMDKSYSYDYYDADGNKTQKTYTLSQTTKDTMRLAEPLDFPYTITFDAKTAYDKVLDYCGCIMKKDGKRSLDDYDLVMLSDTRNGTATYGNSGNMPGIINDQTDCIAPGASSAWPELTATTDDYERIKDTDGDGMPDAWETANGLNPNSATDGKTYTLDAQYTNLEVYLNSLVADIMEGCQTGGTALGTETGKLDYTTGITSAYEGTTSRFTNRHGFNLAGQRVNHNFKGIVIKNGKKIVN